MQSSYQKFIEFDSAYGFTEKCGFRLSPIQEQDVESFVQWPVSGNFYEVGAGKTVISTVVSLMGRHDLTIVTVPPILITPWVRWLNKVSDRVAEFRGTPKARKEMDLSNARWIVVSHALFRDEFDRLFTESYSRTNPSIIVDECFTGETLITTDRGDLKISEIVKGKLKVKALSLNYLTNGLEWKPVVNWITNKPPTKLLKVTHEQGTFTCTPNHRIFTNSGYKEASKLVSGDTLTTAVRSGTGQREEDVHMRSLPSRVCRSDHCESPVLLHKVQDENAEAKPGVSAEVFRFYKEDLGNSGSPKQREAKPKSVSLYVGKQPDEVIGVRRKDESNSIEDRSQTQGSGGERERAYSSAGNTGTKVEPCYRTLDCNEVEQTCRWDSVQLQDRLSVPRKDASSGGGWGESFRGSKEGPRREKDFSSDKSRVESVEVLEPGSFGEYGSCSNSDSEVFDLEVADNHNYFANGVAVSNCHAIKNIESKLYKKVKALSQGQSLQLLTGTPISKPLDAYAYIALKTPGLYRSFGQVENLYVDERDFFGKVLSYKNLGQLAEHFAMQTITRTKLEIHGYDNPPNYPDSAYTLSDAHYKLYEKLVEEQMLKFDDGQKIDATSATKLYHALQQIVVNYDHFSNDPKKKSAAFDLLDLTIEQTECEKIDKSKLIVWTNYKMTSAKVLQYLLDKGIKAVAAYSGGNAEKSVAAFMDDPTCRVLVAQYQSAGMGLNPQAVCWESLFLELTTVPIYMRQALGRIDRLGQKHVPTQRLAFAQGTVQESLLARLLKNDDEAVEVEVTKESLRRGLLCR